MTISEQRAHMTRTKPRAVGCEVQRCPRTAHRSARHRGGGSQAEKSWFLGLTRAPPAMPSLHVSPATKNAPRKRDK